MILTNKDKRKPIKEITISKIPLKFIKIAANTESYSVISEIGSKAPSYFILLASSLFVAAKMKLGSKCLVKLPKQFKLTPTDGCIFFGKQTRSNYILTKIAVGELLLDLVNDDGSLYSQIAVRNQDGFCRLVLSPDPDIKEEDCKVIDLVTLDTTTEE